MQTKKWSNEDLREEFEGCLDLGEVISRLETDFLKDGEVICGIRVNGMFLTQEDELKFSDSHVSDISELEVSSQRPEDLINNSMESVLSWVPKVRDYAIEVADTFRGQDQKEAQKSFGDIVDGCRWLTDALGLLKGILTKNSAQESFAERWEILEKELSTIIVEISSSYDRKDYMCLADILEYELSSSMDKWLELLGPEKSAMSEIL